MKIENPLAFRYILQDDVYLLNNDKDYFAHVAPIEPIVVTPSITFNYLGGNKKNFLALVHYPEVDFMYEQHLIALESTLKRLNFLLDDIAIINIANNNEAVVEDLTDFFKPQRLLILGKNALMAGHSGLSLNNLITERNCRTLYTFSFDQMMANIEYKKIFWEQMKQL